MNRYGSIYVLAPRVYECCLSSDTFVASIDSPLVPCYCGTIRSIRGRVELMRYRLVDAEECSSLTRVCVKCRGSFSWVHFRVVWFNRIPVNGVIVPRYFLCTHCDECHLKVVREQALRRKKQKESTTPDTTSAPDTSGTRDCRGECGGIALPLEEFPWRNFKRAGGILRARAYKCKMCSSKARQARHKKKYGVNKKRWEGYNEH